MRLLPFTRDDFGDLIAQVTDARFLLQWAGPEYRHPLDEVQLERTLRSTVGPLPSLYAFKAVEDDGNTVGHVQLMGVDRGRSTAVLGRVLLFAEYRGRGMGRSLVALALSEAFDRLTLDLVTLHVFAFNRAAMATYEHLGFTAIPGGPGARVFEGERWEVVRMGLDRITWADLGASAVPPSAPV